MSQTIQSKFPGSSQRHATNNGTPLIPIHQKIHERALEISARYKKAEIELIGILEQVENHKVYLHHGRSSLFQYGVIDLQLSESVAYNLITVMRKTREVPELRTEIQQGNINLSNARRIVPILTNENQSEWLQKAATLTQKQLEKAIVKDHPASAVQERARYVTESRIKIELGLSEENMMKLRRAQDLVSQSLGKPACLENTLNEMTAFYLKHKDPVTRAKRIELKKGLLKSKNARSDPPVLLGSISGIISGAISGAISKSISEALSETPTKAIPIELVSIQVENDLPIPLPAPASSTILIPGGLPTLPNKREPIPSSILHQVNLRDQRHCTHLNQNGQRCNQSRWTEVHHRTPVALGGKNTLENLTTLCSVHHQWVHAGHRH